MRQAQLHPRAARLRAVARADAAALLGHRRGRPADGDRLPDAYPVRRAVRAVRAAMSQNEPSSWREATAGLATTGSSSDRIWRLGAARPTALSPRSTIRATRLTALSPRCDPLPSISLLILQVRAAAAAARGGLDPRPAVAARAATLLRDARARAGASTPPLRCFSPPCRCLCPPLPCPRAGRRGGGLPPRPDAPLPPPRIGPAL